MEQKHKKILEELHEKITDIDVNNGILELLKDNGILTPQDLSNINRETDRVTKATLLLSILPQYVYSITMNSLFIDCIL